MATKFIYSDPADTRGELVTEIAKIIGILLGIGATAWLRERLTLFWLLGASMGVLTICAGIYYWGRQSMRSYAAQGNLSAGKPAFRTWLKEITRQFRNRLKAIWPRRGNNANSVSATNRAQKQEAIEKKRIITVLPIITILIGILILLPAVAAFGFRRLAAVDQAGLVAVYFSGPAILLWLLGEGVYMYPHFLVTPKHRPQILGIAKSACQIVSALFLWVYLGVGIGMSHTSWMFFLSAGLAGLGFILGIVTILIQQEASNPLNVSPVPNRV